MKTFTKLLLTNWHYFSHEVMDLGQINFLTGENGSGKTTIIDALQLIVLGDTAGHFFNKSASDKSSRSLSGYLRCEIGDKDDGSALYLRNGRFSSYVACEIRNDDDDTYFTLGVVFDTFEDGGHENKYFYFNDRIPENEFIENKTPLSQKQLNVFFANSGSEYRMFNSNIDYREFIKDKLGKLSNNFFGLFKKAIPFTPINNIETFITEYVCDVENTINVEKMQENFRNYKKLEIETEELVKRVNKLTEIVEKYNDWAQKQESISIKKYILDRSDLYLAAHAEDEIKVKVSELEADIEEAKAMLEKTQQAIDEQTKKKEGLMEEKFQSDIYKRKAIYEERYASITKKIEELSDELNTVQNNLLSYIDSWTNGLSDAMIDLGDKFTSSTSGILAKEVLNLLKQLNEQVNINSVESNTLTNVYNKLNDLQSEIKRHQFSILNNDFEIKNRIDSLNKEIIELNDGKKSYDSRLVEFRSIIQDGLKNKYGKDVAVNFLADLIDLKDESWRLAVETYLNTQRFYLIVEPQYVNESIKIYDKVKNTLPYFDYGIVDTEKVLLNAKDPLENSLANEVISDNDAAKAYINMLLGALIKCNSISHLRDHARTITKDCMLYQNYVARNLNTKNVSFFIGSKSSIQQKELKEKEIKSLYGELNSIKNEVATLGKLTALEVFNSNEVRNIAATYEAAKDLDSLIKDSKSTKEIMDSMSDNFLEKIEASIEVVQKQIDGLVADKEDINSDIVKAKVAIERLEKEDLPASKERVKALKEKINKDYVRNWIAEVGEPKFLEILAENPNPISIYNKYKIEIESTLSSLQYQWRSITDARTKYNTIYELNYDPYNQSNDDYQKEYVELGEIKLKSYLEKIQEAKANAMKEFRNDFLAKLKSNFDTVISQITSLNSALEYAQFGVDSYKFSVEPRSEYKEYFDMINDPLLLTGIDIEGDEFAKKYENTVENLFRQITFTDSDDARSELEKNIVKYTDYRSYLKFDLIVTNQAGYKQRLSKTLGSKSGGETQTPFYISVLASFAQTYRLYMKNEKNNPIRLIVFDEAFSKMDATRVAESIKLLRSFGLQALISAPSDKAQIISPLVDKTICVVRDNTNATTRSFAEK